MGLLKWAPIKRNLRSAANALPSGAMLPLLAALGGVWYFVFRPNHRDERLASSGQGQSAPAERGWNGTNTESKPESHPNANPALHKSNRLTLEIPRKALRFKSEGDFSTALDLVATLGRGLQYNHLPESENGLPGLLLPEDSYRQLLPLLKGRVDFIEVQAIPVSGLPLDEQERIRKGRT